MAKNKPKSSKNVNNTLQNKPKNSNHGKAQTVGEHKPINKKRLIIIIVSALLGLSIIVGVAFGVWYAIYARRFDYLSGNISKYITLSKEDYSGYEVNATVPLPSELDVDERILQTLAKHKSKTPLNNGYYYRPDAPIANGWKLRIWYMGYTLDEDGKKVEIEGTSNFTSTSATELEIGSGSFVSGFEISLIGKYMADYSKFSSVVKGSVRADDIVIVTMDAMLTESPAERYQNLKIDLAADDVDEMWGAGFRDALTGIEIGTTLQDPLVLRMPNGFDAVYENVKVTSAIRPTVTYTDGSYSNGERITVEYTVTPTNGEARVERTSFTLDEAVIGGNFGGALRELLYTLLGGGEIGEQKTAAKTDIEGNVYSNPKVVSAERREDKPITLDAHFPYDYGEKSLRGKTVKFDVYVTDAVVYNAPTLTDEFITETLKITAESLADYEGQTLTEKYREKVRAELMAEYDAVLEAQTDELVWEHLLSCVSYDDGVMPKGELRAVMNSYIEDFEAFCELYSNEYETEAYAAVDYFGISDGSKWREYVREIAVKDIVERMIFYYIAREESFLPDGQTELSLYNEKVDSLLSDYLEYKKCKRENYSTEEEYLAAVAAYRLEVIEKNGEAAIIEAVRYEYVMPKIIALATVIKP